MQSWFVFSAWRSRICSRQPQYTSWWFQRKLFQESLMRSPMTNRWRVCFVFLLFGSLSPLPHFHLPWVYFPLHISLPATITLPFSLYISPLSFCLSHPPSQSQFRDCSCPKMSMFLWKSVYFLKVRVSLKKGVFLSTKRLCFSTKGFFGKKISRKGINFVTVSVERGLILSLYTGYRDIRGIWDQLTYVTMICWFQGTSSILE